MATKDQIQKILQMVQEGKISAEAGAELIENLKLGSEEAAEETAQETTETTESTIGADSIAGLTQKLQTISKQISEKFHLEKLADDVEAATKKGVDAVKEGFESLKKGPNAWFLPEERREITLPLAIGEGQDLICENRCGDIRVIGSSNESKVCFIARFRRETEEEAKEAARNFSPVIEESEGLIVIRQSDLQNTDIQIEVHVQKALDVEAKTSSGNVHLLSVGGGARIETLHGEIDVHGANGRLELKTENGNIRVNESNTPYSRVESYSGDVLLRKLQGNSEIRTANGDIELRNCILHRFEAESVSGDILFQNETAGRMEAKVSAVNGDVMMRLAEGSSGRVRLSSVSGRAVSSAELNDHQVIGNAVEGVLGSGEGRIDLSSVSGNVTLASVPTPSQRTTN
ncbi:MAG: DUF4097 family beta strand repeat-containing protein [Fimbriimonadaceae bacterium]